MRIGLMIYGSLDTLSGGYLYDRQLVKYLRQQGCQVEILSLPWRNYAAHLCDNLRIDWARRIADAQYDLLLQDELNHPSLLLLNNQLKQWCPCPLISIVHHLRSSENHPTHLMLFYRAVERQYLRSVNGFVFNSLTTKSSVLQMIAHDKAHVVAYPAADHRDPPSHDEVLAAITARSRQQAPLQLLFIGNLMARKGLHTVLSALPRLDPNKWHLHIVGSAATDPSYSAAMWQRAHVLGIASCITWHGRTSDDKLAALLRTCDLLVMPSYEGFGIVYLEAMAYGIPVIAAATGAAPEVIHSGVNGYIAPPNDDQSLGDTLRLLQNNRVHLATLAYHARLRYEQHPTWAMSMQAAHEWLCECPH